jgi:hypothetical protein
MNYLELSPAKTRAAKLQCNELASSIYKCREEYSQAEKVGWVADEDRADRKFDGNISRGRKVSVRARAR